MKKLVGWFLILCSPILLVSMGKKSGITTRSIPIVKFKNKPATTLQETRWNKAEVAKHKRHSVERIVAKIERSKSRYELVSAKTGVPWYIIASFHNMEASLNFSKHLHNGNPLTKRTYWVPKGRPVGGKPPFTWEFSAEDALKYDKMGRIDWKVLDSSLYASERYNGTGYLRYHKNVPTPYLWSYTSIYTRGKYISDGKWSNTAVSKQCGIVPIWKLLEERGHIKFK